MSDQTQFPPQIQTLGPADPNAPLIQKAYTIVSGLMGIVAILGTLGLITTEQSASIAQVGTTGGMFVGALTTAVAAFRTKKQVRNGTFTEAPVLPAVPALEQMKILRDTAQQEINRAQTQATGAVDAIQEAVAKLPGGGLINAAVNAAIPDQIEDLLRSVRR